MKEGRWYLNFKTHSQRGWSCFHCTSTNFLKNLFNLFNWDGLLYSALVLFSEHEMQAHGKQYDLSTSVAQLRELNEQW